MTHLGAFLFIAIAGGALALILPIPLHVSHAVWIGEIAGALAFLTLTRR